MTNTEKYGPQGDIIAEVIHRAKGATEAEVAMLAAAANELDVATKEVACRLITAAQSRLQPCQRMG